MNSYPSIEASFIIEGIDLNLEELTKKFDIQPIKTRDIDDWPKAVKMNDNLPKEMQPRFVWSVYDREDGCKKVETPIRKLMSKLEGKEQILIEFCEKKDLKMVLTIVIHAEAMELPEIVLSPDILSYFGKLKVEIGFDIYTY